MKLITDFKTWYKERQFVKQVKKEIARAKELKKVTNKKYYILKFNGKPKAFTTSEIMQMKRQRIIKFSDFMELEKRCLFVVR